MSSKLHHTLTEDVLPSLQGVIPSAMVTCSVDGVPNATPISQVFYVDEKHVAVSHQFFKKTLRNIQENPVMCVIITCPLEYKLRKLQLRYKETQESGEIFESMKMQLDIIAARQGMEGIFVLKAAEIFEVLSIEVLE